MMLTVLLRWLGYIIGGALAILLVFTLLWLALGLIAGAFGQEATPVREATLSEQGDSLAYQGYEDVVFGPAVVETTIIVEAPSTQVLQYPHGCAYHNDVIRAHVNMIARNIAKDPEHGHYYERVLTLLDSQLCVTNTGEVP